MIVAALMTKIQFFLPKVKLHGVEFVETLVSQYYEGRMTARTVCVLCWFASRAGAHGASEQACNAALCTVRPLF